MCFPRANRAVNSCRCLKDESCSLVYSPGKLLALFFVETWPDCKQLVVQNGLNVHDVSSTSFVDLDPNQVSSQLVQQLRMICMKISISSDNNAKDAMRVHKLDSTQTELFRRDVYGNYERLGLGHFGIIQRIDCLDVLVESCNPGNECLSVFVYFPNDKQGVSIHQRVTLVAELVHFPWTRIQVQGKEH